MPAVTQRIYDCVAAHPQGIATRQLCDYVYADHPDGGPGGPEVTVRTLVWAMNKKYLRQLGLAVRGQGGPGSVYRLVSVSEKGDAR